MSRILHFIMALILILVLALSVSHNRKNIRVRFIIQLLIIEIMLAYFLLNSKIGLDFVKNFTDLFNNLLSFSTEGIDFVFGNMNKKGLAFFFLNVLCPIIFISALIGILQYIRILPFIICIIGTILSKINGMGKLESFNAVSSLIFGQSENFIIYKNILGKIPEYRIYTLAATAMSTVSMSIVGSYMTMLIPKYVVSALILNIFSTFIILSLLNPYQINNEEDLQINILYKKQNLFEMFGEYIFIGFKVAINIAAMLIGFIAIIAAINSFFILLFGISFQRILGYVFFPLAWIIGIPENDLLQVSSIMATKLVSNEFVAMIDLQKFSEKLSSRSVGILSVFLVSFANFSSIGIITGSIKELDEHQSNVVSRYSIKLIYGSTLVSVLSAAIAGLVIF